jgi:methionyl-tRNA synthetase
MVHKYFAGVVPEVDPDIEQELHLGLESDALSAIAEFENAMGAFDFQGALKVIWQFISNMNKYVDVTAPWILAKKKSTRKQLGVVIYNLLEGLRIISGLIYPVMPDTAVTMQEHLGLDPEAPFYLLESLKKWKTMAPETQLRKSITLFPRITFKREKNSSPAGIQSASLSPPIKPEIDMDTFNTIDLRVATVLHAEKIPRAKKLLKLDVDLGEKRTIVAGISESYDPEDLVGKQVVIVANLKPAKIMGILSNGMLIASEGKTGHSIATPDRPLKPGTPLG